MKVIMVETGGWGGISHYSWNLCSALSEAGVEVCLLTNVRYELDHLPRKFIAVPCFDGKAGYIQTVRRFMRQLTLIAPEILHVQSLISTRFDGLLWPIVRRRMPLVFTAHDVRSHEGARWESWTLWRSLRAADAIIVHTHESVEEARWHLGPNSRIELIHHGDYAFFGKRVVTSRATLRHQLDLPVDGSLLLAFGAIRPYKGIYSLIAALPRIRARRRDVYLVIVGPLMVGSEEEYRDAIMRAGVKDAVIFRPSYVPHDQVADYFAAADVAVYNYSEVTDSGSLRIACSQGIPVVATAVGSFREFLTDGVNARLVPLDDPDAFAVAVNEILADPSGAARLAHAALNLSASEWSWLDSAKATVELYRALLRRAGTRKA